MISLSSKNEDKTTEKGSSNCPLPRSLLYLTPIFIHRGWYAAEKNGLPTAPSLEKKKKNKMKIKGDGWWTSCSYQALREKPLIVAWGDAQPAFSTWIHPRIMGRRRGMTQKGGSQALLRMECNCTQKNHVHVSAGILIFISPYVLAYLCTMTKEMQGEWFESHASHSY